jgi:cullin 1
VKLISEYGDVRDFRNKAQRADSDRGRKLTWLWHVSKNELRTTYLSQKYIFMTSSYQMAILVCFNDSDSVSYRDIATITGLDDKILRPQMALLAKSKVLLQDEDTFELNMSKWQTFWFELADVCRLQVEEGGTLS